MHKPHGQNDFLPFLLLMMMGNNRHCGNDKMPLLLMLMMMMQQPHPHPMPMPHPHHPHGHSAHSAHSLEG